MTKHLRLILSLILAAGIALAGPSKISSDLDKEKDKSDSKEHQDIIVQFRQTPTTNHHAKVTGLGGQLKKLADDADVKYISGNRRLKGALDLTAAAINLSAAASYSLDGAGVGIAVLDSGVSLHQDLKTPGGASRIVYSEDFTGSYSTSDGYGHGTHVAGIAAGNGSASASAAGSSRSFRGVAPAASIINLRVLDSTGSGSDADVIEAIQRAIALKSTYNIRVLNLSLGRGVYESYTVDPLCQAVESAWNAGIIVVVAAGNEGRNNSGGIDGYGTITSPGNDPLVITVGAMKALETADRSDDRIASYSSKGPSLYDHMAKPDLLAPGNQIRAALSSPLNTLFLEYPASRLLLSYYATGDPLTTATDYFTLNGTSMATPVVSGAAALLVQREPSLTPDQVKARLMRTAHKAFPSTSSTTDPVTGITYVSHYDLFTVGAGYLDIAAALADTETATGSAASPTAVRDENTGQVSLVFGTAVVWGTGTNGTIDPASVVWGTGSGAGALDAMSVLVRGER
jgi:serine protease AprX